MLILLAATCVRRAFAGDTEGAMAAFDLWNRRAPRGTATADQIAKLADLRAEDAIQAIVEQARTKRVVLLNEAHHVPMQGIALREQGQARNLIERIFAKDKDAKVFIYVGYGHLQKTPPGSAGTTMLMGEYLRRMTGLDMLHVDQTALFAHPQRDDENPLYGPIVEKSSSSEPFVLRAPDGSHPVLLGMQGSVDMQVIHPRYGARDGRRIIKAYRMEDPPDAVPADAVLVEAGKPIPSLMLPAGEFRYSYED